jgi:hypothetical protein
MKELKGSNMRHEVAAKILSRYRVTYWGEHISVRRSRGDPVHGDVHAENPVSSRSARGNDSHRETQFLDCSPVGRNSTSNVT